MSELEPVQQNILIPITSLYEHKRNFRSHPPEQIKKLKASLERWGQVRSIVAQVNTDGTYTIVAGHGLVQAAQELVNANTGCYERFGKMRVDVIPASWSPEQVTGYLVADNTLSQDASDDNELLVALLQEQQDAGYDLASLGTDDETLRQMLEALGDEYAGGGSQDDDEDEFDEEVDEEQTRVQVGDVWRLGKHVIACVNSCDGQAVKKLIGDRHINLVFSDPPYGVDVVDNDGHIGASNAAQVNTYAPVIGDKGIDTAVNSYRLSVGQFPQAKQIWWGANYYAHELPPVSCWLIWDKRSDSSEDEGMNPNNFADCELAWTNINTPSRIYRQLWCGMIRSGEHEKRVHPTQKPVNLALWSFKKFGSPEDIIFDPFLGSGISVIAAEKLGDRSVIGCELSPIYCDVVIRRWEEISGGEAKLISRLEAVNVS